MTPFIVLHIQGTHPCPVHVIPLLILPSHLWGPTQVCSWLPAPVYTHSGYPILPCTCYTPSDPLFSPLRPHTGLPLTPFTILYTFRVPTPAPYMLYPFWPSPLTSEAPHRSAPHSQHHSVHIQGSHSCPIHVIPEPEAHLVIVALVGRADQAGFIIQPSVRCLDMHIVTWNFYKPLTF